MHKISKKSEASIALIVAAVIGLIIIVVIIAMVGGKLGSFSKGSDDSVAGSAGEFNLGTCNEACKLLGKIKSTGDYTAESCISTIPSSLRPKVISGSYSDVTGTNVCCCRDP